MAGGSHGEGHNSGVDAGDDRGGGIAGGEELVSRKEERGRRGRRRRMKLDIEDKQVRRSGEPRKREWRKGESVVAAAVVVVVVSGGDRQPRLKRTHAAEIGYSGID